MEYLILCQDDRNSDVIRPLGTSKLVKDYGLITENWDDLNDLPEQCYLSENSGGEYVDFIASPASLISDHLKQLYQQFDPQIFFKPLVLADVTKMRQELYWLVNPPRCACVAAESEFNKDGTIKRLVIDRRKAGGKWIFKVAGLMEHWIVINLGVAECMLRRDYCGVKFQRVETD
jgi:hypothetical protein